MGRSSVQVIKSRNTFRDLLHCLYAPKPLPQTEVGAFSSVFLLHCFYSLLLCTVTPECCFYSLEDFKEASFLCPFTSLQPTPPSGDSAPPGLYCFCSVSMEVHFLGAFYSPGVELFKESPISVFGFITGCPSVPET